MSTIKSSAENLTLNADGANNDIILQSNGSTKVTLDGQNGRVGIGTSSPLYPLHTYLNGDNAIYIQGGTSGSSTLHLGDADDIDVGNISYNHSSNYLAFRTNASERLRILDGGGITFNGDTAEANALGDYEEGVHVVTATDSGGGATYGLNSPADTLAYTKVGRLVTITGTLVCTTVTGTPTGTIQLSLPFACANLSEHGGKSGGAGVGYYQVQKYTSGVFPQLSIAEGTSIATLYYGVVDANHYETYFNTASQVYCNFSYFTG